MRVREGSLTTLLTLGPRCCASSGSVEPFWVPPSAECSSLSCVALHTHSPLTFNDCQSSPFSSPRILRLFPKTSVSVPRGSIWKGPALLSCHSGTMFEVHEALAAGTLLRWKLRSPLSDSDPSWVSALLHFSPLLSSGLILNRIHQQSEREASSPRWKRTQALVKGGRERRCGRMSPAGDNGRSVLSNGSTFQSLAPSLMAMPSLEPGNWDKAVSCSRRWATWAPGDQYVPCILGSFYLKNQD